MRSLRRCEALREFSEYKHFHTSALGQAPVWALLLRNAVWPGRSGKDLGRSGQTLSCSHMFFKGLKRETIPISLNWHAEFPHILPKPLSVKIDFRAHIWHSRTASSSVLRCGLVAVEITSRLHLSLNDLSLKTWPDRWRLWKMACSEPVHSSLSPQHLLKCRTYVQLPRQCPRVDTLLCAPVLSGIDTACGTKTARMPRWGRKAPTSISNDDVGHTKSESGFYHPWANPVLFTGAWHTVGTH